MAFLSLTRQRRYTELVHSIYVCSRLQENRDAGSIPACPHQGRPPELIPRVHIPAPRNESAEGDRIAVLECAEEGVKVTLCHSALERSSVSARGIGSQGGADPSRCR